VDFRRTDPVQMQVNYRQPIDELKKRIATQSNQWILHQQSNEDDKKVEKEIRLNLNKCTPENFDIMKSIFVKHGCFS
jgi:hypothetical protein